MSSSHQPTRRPTNQAAILGILFAFAVMAGCTILAIFGVRSILDGSWLIGGLLVAPLAAMAGAAAGRVARERQS